MSTETKRTDLTPVFLIVLVLQVVLSGGLFFRINQVHQLIVDAPSSVRLETSRVDVSPDDDPSLGPDGAPVTIVVFSSYTCGACSQLRPTLDQVLEAYPDEVRLVYRNFCHEGGGSPGFAAAQAAGCADEQGAFWEMHDLLFENAPVFDRGSLRTYSAMLELDLEAYDACMESDKSQAEVARDTEDGRSYGVAATPTSFVNGRRLVGTVSFLTFQRAIEDALGD
jgi:protein-disulfide isomerase